MRGKVIYLLALVVLVQFIYPITDGNAPVPLLIYQAIYMSLMVAGIVVARENPFSMRLLIALGVLWFVAGAVYTFNQGATWALLLAYGAIAPFQILVVRVLLQYIFNARQVTRDVIYAASAVYLLLGAVFIPIYGTLETVTFDQTGDHAFLDGQSDPDEVVSWQTFIYYSYATLTTLGYGDVLPATMWARSLASLEAVIGVLYVTVIMARLVGLYASRDDDS